MELGTFGAILTYAIDFEGKITRFYASASQAGAEAAGTFGQLAQEGEKRLKVLERTRRECVAEMILEPITGFRSEDYEINADDLGEDPVKRAREIEKLAVEYYQIASEKVSVPEVSRVLKKISGQHSNQKAIVDAL